MLQLYKNIKRRRIELGLTQSDVANKLGYSDKSMIAKVEKGLVDLPQSKIIAFAEALNVSASNLMGWDTNLENSGAFVANMIMDPEFTNYAKALFAMNEEQRNKVYGYIDALSKEKESE